MAKRKLKKVSVAQPKPLGIIYDHRVTDRNPEDFIDVENPYDREQTIRVSIEMRDPLTWMHSRGIIDEPRRIAGEEWRRRRQQSQFGLGAIDTTKQSVDGGKIYEPISDNQLDAARYMRECRWELEALGLRIEEPQMNFIIESFLAEHRFLGQIAALLGRRGDRWVTYYTGRIRDGLNTIAIVFTVRS